MPNMKRITQEVQVNFRVGRTQREEIRRMAWEKNMSVSTVVRNALIKAKIISSTEK